MEGRKPRSGSDRYFEEIEEGEQLTVENIRTITEADIVNFAGLAGPGDFHPQHLSKEFAKETEFDGRIAQGNLIFIITEATAVEPNRKALASYGHDNLRYVNPVLIGDTLSVQSEVIETSEYNEELGRVVYKYTTSNQNGDTVLVDEHIVLVEKESSG